MMPPTRHRLLVLTAAILVLASCNAADPRREARSSPTPARSGAPSEPSAEETVSPEGGPTLRFAAIGDFGTGAVPQLAVAARMCRWERKHPFEMVVTTGDNVYPSADPDLFQATFFSPYSCLFKRGVEWHASLGNHDWAYEEGGAVLAEELFGMRGENYVIERGGVRLVIVNSNDLDRAWLGTHLGDDDGWTVAVFHHPVFSPGMHGPTPGFQDLHDLFVASGVDLVLNGHDHLYAAMKPRDGIRYVVTGGGGADLYPCLPSAGVEVCELRHHFVYVQATPSALTVTAVPSEGEPFHTFSTTGIEPGD